jgi:hypothetical protein
MGEIYSNALVFLLLFLNCIGAFSTKEIDLKYDPDRELTHDEMKIPD